MGDKGFMLIELLVWCLIIALVVLIALGVQEERKQKLEFIEYCQTKGFTKDDCKWEWKRMRNGNKSDGFVFVPMPLMGG